MLGGCLTNDEQVTETPGVGTPTATETAATETKTEEAEPVDCESPAGDTTATNSRFDVSVSFSNKTEVADVTGELSHPESSDQPARFEVAFQNTSASKTLYRFGTVPPFSGHVLEHVSQDSRLVILTESQYQGFSDPEWDDDELEVVPDSRTDGCWQVVHVPVAADHFSSFELAPCEVETVAFYLLAHPDNDDCLPEGRYERTDQWWLPDSDREGEITLRVDVSDTVER